MVMYDNNMIMSLKQKKRKLEPRIKLNHNIYILGDFFGMKQMVKILPSFRSSISVSLKQNGRVV